MKNHSHFSDNQAETCATIITGNPEFRLHHKSLLKIYPTDHFYFCSVFRGRLQEALKQLQTDEITMQSIKCFVIGDNEVEIASLLISYTKGAYPDNHPTMFCEYPRTVILNGDPYSLGLYHITGLEDYPRLRPLSYAGTDVFLVCFSVVSPSTYENVIEMWVPDINQHCPNTPFLLVGTHIDLRDDSTTLEKLAKNKQCPLSPEDGEKLAQELKAVKYLECSAKTQKGLKEVFDEAILAALEEEDGLEGAQPKKCRTCCVLL